MIKKIIPISGIIAASAIVIAGCGAKEASIQESTIVQTIENTVEPAETITEPIKEPVESTTTGTSVDNEITVGTTVPNTVSESEGVTEGTSTGESKPTDPVNTPEQDGRDESYVTNADGDVINATVGDYIDLTEVTGGGYTVGNISILSGDAVSVVGRDSLIAESKGDARIRCTLYDEDTGTSTQSDYTVRVK